MASSNPKAHGRLAQYRAEATKGPFVLELDDDNTLTIPAPNGNVLLQMDTIFTTDGILRKLAGDHYDAVLEAVGGEDGAVLIALMKDMQRHWGLGGYSASST